VYGKTLELKRDLSSPRGVMRTLVAFSNTAGGKIIVGIDDRKQVVGVDRPLDEEERLCSMIADSIRPRLIPNIELMTVEGKTLLIVEVFLSNSRPHYISAEGVSYDELPMMELTEDDLDLNCSIP